MQVVVWTPPFLAGSGGITALHKLCYLLRQHDVDARVWINKAKASQHDLSTKFAVPIANGEVDPNEGVVIYPEIADGHPIGGDIVVRWFLNRTGFMYPDGEINVHYAQHFFPEADPAHQLTVIERWPSLFYDAGKPRRGGCFTVRKGEHKPRNKDIDSLTPMPWCSPEDAAEIFHKHKLFYSYDSATFLSVQAALCGCLSIVIPDDGVTAAQWRQGHPVMRYGVAYGAEELPWALQTMKLVDPHLKTIEAEADHQIEALLARLRLKGRS